MKTYWQLSVISLCMAVLGIQSAIGAVDATLEAKQAIELEQHSAAEERLRELVAEKPGTVAAFEAIRERGNLEAELGNCAELEYFVGLLERDFAEHPDAAVAVRGFANRLAYDVKDYSKAIPLYRRMLKRWPDSPAGHLARRGLIFSLILEGELAAAAVEVETLRTVHADHPNLPETLKFLAGMFVEKADNLRQQGNFFYALEFYEYLISKWPDFSNLLAVKKNAVLCQIELWQYDRAEQQARKILIDYAEDAGLPEIVYQMADAFYYKYKSVALELLDYYASHWPKYERSFEVNEKRQILPDYENIRTEVNALLAYGLGNPDTFEPLKKAAWRYYDLPSCVDAANLFKLVLTHWPDQDLSDVYGWLVRCTVCVGNFDAADRYTRQLTERYADHPNYKDLFADVDGLKQTAKQKTAQRAVLSRDLHTYLQEQTEAIISYINAGDDKTAGEMTEQILKNPIFQETKDFNLASTAGHSLVMIAERYYEKGVETGDKEKFLKSIATFKRLLPVFADNPHYASIAYYTMGLAYRQMGEWLSAADEFMNSIKTDPKFQYADYCRLAAEECFDRFWANNSTSTPWEDDYRQAQCYEQAGDIESAKIYYLKYLDSAKNDDPKRLIDAQKKIKKLSR